LHRQILSSEFNVYVAVPVSVPRAVATGSWSLLIYDDIRMIRSLPLVVLTWKRQAGAWNSQHCYLNCRCIFV